MTDTTLAKGNPLYFRKNLSEKINILIMTNDDKIRNEKLQLILTEKQQKYWHCKYEYLSQVKKYCLLIKVE